MPLQVIIVTTLIPLGLHTVYNKENEHTGRPFSMNRESVTDMNARH